MDYKRSKNHKHLKLENLITNQVDMVPIGNNIYGNWKETQLYTKEVPQVQEIME